MKRRGAETENAGPFLREGSRSFLKGQRGSVLFYIFIAIGLLAALTFAFTRDSRTNVSAQVANKNSQELYVQVNMIRSALMECALSWPGGGPDSDSNGTIEASENPNTPYPLNPVDNDNLIPPATAAAADDVRNVLCPGAPDGQRNIFQGDNGQGRFLPPPPSGYTEWQYINDMTGSPTVGVRVQITGPGTAGDVEALNKVVSKFSSCQAQLNYGGCGSTCLTVWINRKSACP